MVRTVNAARSMYEISAHASVYIPVSVPSQLPHYVHLDRNSPWHTSALLSTVWESVTLPSRLRADHGRRGLLDDLSATLNINGNLRIATVQMSIPDAIPVTAMKSRGRWGDDRMSDRQWDKSDHRLVLDMDFDHGETPTPTPNGKGKKRDHVFGQVETVRGNSQEENEDDGDTRKRRRLAGLPVIAQSVTRVFYHLPLYHFAALPLYTLHSTLPSFNRQHAAHVSSRLLSFLVVILVDILLLILAF